MMLRGQLLLVIISLLFKENRINDVIEEQS